MTLKITICVEESAAKRLTMGEDDLNGQQALSPRYTS